jgi:nitrate reductase (NAD(P)H)
MISPDIAANEPSWWTDERYAIYDLSPNSAIAYPAHDEALDLSDEGAAYDVRGYAYAGGGRRVTRVELSLDKGRTWRLADIDYAEDKYRDSRPAHLYGGLLDMVERDACFCWCFWALPVSVAELRNADDLVVRAMDEGLSVQPRDMYWNVMGMMNNPWFRVAIHKDEGEKCLRFEHPTQPALKSGGWMERVKKEGGDISNGYWGEQTGDEVSRPVADDEAQPISMTNPEVKNTISFEQLREHEVEESPWFVVENQVYDGTPFLQAHPGGAQSIEAAAGQDVTEEFMAIHSETARAMMKDYHVGSLQEGSQSTSPTAEQADQGTNGDSSSAFLERRHWKNATLYSKTSLSRNARLLTFKLDHENQQLGLPVGQHVLMKLRDPATREVIIRAYTPISSPSKLGFVDVLIKVYFDTKDSKGGKMSQAIEALPIGHSIEIKGPLGKFEYLGSGRCKKNDSERRVKTFIMISGGTGITPIYQILHEIMTDPKDETKCIVLTSNHEVEDILCESELGALAKDNKDNCEIHHTLTQPHDKWNGLRGRIDGKMLKKLAGRDSHGPRDAMVLVCGPGPLEKSVHNTLLGDGWTDEDIVFF